MGIEVWEGIAGVMILEESGSSMSIAVVSWDWRRIQGFVVDSEMKFRVWICKGSASVRYINTEQFVLEKIPVSVEQHMQWLSNAFLLGLCVGHTPLLSTKPLWNSWELPELVACCLASCPRHGCKCG